MQLNLKVLKMCKGYRKWLLINISNMIMVLFNYNTNNYKYSKIHKDNIFILY